jgi:S-(hydroxymethyl)glutathione dehydrogenase/alcohol dehydrogenase
MADDGPKNAVSRRGLIGAGLASGAAAAAAAPAARAASARPSGATTGGLKIRAFMRRGTTPFIDHVTLDPLGEHRVLVRTQACQCCYSIVSQAFAGGTPTPEPLPRILGHGGVGIVEAVGAGVRRVKPGDRVVVANTPQCGSCYNCIRGRPDVCQCRGFASKLNPIGKLGDGTPVLQHNNEGGFADYMVPYEEYCVAVPTNVPAGELSMLGCVSGCALGIVNNLAPVYPGAIVIVFGCGPVGLSAIQGAKIRGAGQIIAVEPIAARRDAALKLGASVVFDPRAEGAGLVKRIKQLCRGWSDVKYSGSRWREDVNADANQLGGDIVIEAAGGDRGNTTQPSLSPDPDGILPLQQAWELTSEGGCLITPSVSQRGSVSFPAGRWTNSSRTHISSQFGGTHILRDIPRYTNLIEQGLFDAKALTTMSVGLDEVQSAFQAVANRTTIGAVVLF